MEKDFLQGLKLLQEHLPQIIEISLRLITALLIFIAGLLIGNACARRIENISRIDKTLRSFLAGFIKYAIIAVALVTILGQLGVQTASLLAVLGAAGLALGLALQGTLSNVAASVMILILRPFNVGDYIMSENIGGTVVSLGLFGTELSTPDNVYIFVPNSKIWNANIHNFSKNPLRRQDIAFSISYSDDIGRTMKVIEALLQQESRIKTEPVENKPQVIIDSLGDFSINLTARFWCASADYWQLQWDMRRQIKETLDQEGIQIPFPTYSVIQKSAA